MGQELKPPLLKLGAAGSPLVHSIRTLGLGDTQYLLLLLALQPTALE